MLLNVISRPGDAFAAMRHLLEDNHEPRHASAGTSCGPSRSTARCWTAGVVEQLPEPDAEGRRIRLVGDLQLDFALNQPLSPFALAVDRAARPGVADYPLDVLSVIEATLDDPRRCSTRSRTRPAARPWRP